MYPRNEYEMTAEQESKLLEACRPTPAMFLSGGTPMGSSPQENANRAWQALGKEMGFDGDTAQPVHGKGQRFFTAIPSETEEVRKERLAREAEEKKIQNIKRLETEIAELQGKLTAILAA
jgi:hypothetical protein